MLCAQGLKPSNDIYLNVIDPPSQRKHSRNSSTTASSRPHSRTSSIMRAAVPADQTRKYSTSNAFNITVLISGNGTNLQALIDACGTSALPSAHISHVISNRKDAYGLQRAEKAGISADYHNLVKYKKEEADTEDGVRRARVKYDSKLAQIITTHFPSPDLVVCAGWMHVLSDQFINQMQKANIPMINLHPALPGQFSGANAIGRAWEAFQRGEIAGTGVMIHEVISEVDMGKTVVQKEVSCQGCSSETELAERIHQVEWRLIVEGTAKVLKDLERKRKSEGR